VPRLLIVDDEPSYRKTLQDIFQEEGYDVRTASSHQHALDCAAEFIPQVLIVDWMLRDELGGSAVVKSIRKINPQLGVIIISGYPNHEFSGRLGSIDNIQWLEKPFHLADVLAAVQALSAPEISTMDNSR